MSEWNWPDLRNEPIIGIDMETYDPTLKELGCGAFRAKAYGDEYGYVLGIGIATHSGIKHYFSLRHPDSENYDISIVRDYLNKYVLSGTGFLIGANIQYELAWGHYLGLEFKKPLKDVQIAEPLINEERENGYSLAALLQHYFSRPKGEEKLFNAAGLYGIAEK